VACLHGTVRSTGHLAKCSGLSLIFFEKAGGADATHMHIRTGKAG